MSVSGIPERAAIMTRLVDNLAGGRVFKGVLDSETHVRMLGGQVKPYFAVIFSPPFPIPRSKTLNAGDTQTPHMLSCTVTAYAGDMDTAELASAAAGDLLRDWQPTPTTGPLHCEAGYGSDNSDGRKKPTRYDVGLHFSVVINMGPDS